jgi:hypothetical protein
MTPPGKSKKWMKQKGKGAEAPENYAAFETVPQARGFLWYQPPERNQ